MDQKWAFICVALLLPSPLLATPFQDVTTEVGVGVESNSAFGAGVAFLDYDGDGGLDIYVVDGQGDPNAFFHNDGLRVYTEVASQMGLDDTGWGKAAVPADFDNDGDPDLLLTNYSPTETNRLFRNDGAVFTEITAGSGMDFADKCTGAAWGDYDHDALLDVYITVYDGSHRNRFLHNLGGGVFEDIAVELGMADSTGWGYQPAWLDYDDDGDVDLYVGNDDFFGGTPNVLYRNNGDGTFTDVSVESGANLSMSTMGISVGDYDGDLDLDVYLSNIPTGNALLRNNGDGTFNNVAEEEGVAAHVICWGNDFIDYDHDGKLDLYVCAMLESVFMADGGIEATTPWDRFQLQQGSGYPNRVYHNLGQGNGFEDVSEVSGADNDGKSFGSATGDYDKDGDLDIYVTNWYAADGEESSALYENQQIPRGVISKDWFRIKLQGTASNRDGVGARVRILANGQYQIREQQEGTSYLSRSERCLHFGLGGTTDFIDRVDVRWPSGLNEYYESLPAGTVATLVEGDGTVAGIGETVLDLSPGALRVSPNPFQRSADIYLTSSASGPGEVRIVDANGRHVRTLSFTKTGADVLRLGWDGQDASGRSLPAGVYFVQMKLAGFAAETQKVLRLR